MNKTLVTITLISVFILSACQSAQSEVAATSTSEQVIQSTPTLTPQPTATHTNTPEPTPTFTPTLWPSPTAGPTPLGGSEELFFSAIQRVGQQYQSLGVFKFNLVSRKLNQVFDLDYQLQDVSPDGYWLLVSQNSSLFLVNRFGDGLQELTDQFFDSGTRSARWTEDGQWLLWIEEHDQSTAMLARNILSDLPGLAPDWFQENPVEIYQSPDGQHILWASGSCSSYLLCDRDLRLNNLDSPEGITFPDSRQPVLNLTSNFIAYQKNTDSGFTLVVDNVQSPGSSRELNLSEDIPVSYVWQPDGNALMVLEQKRSDYSGKTFGNQLVRFSTGTWQPGIVGEIEGLNAYLTWSPDGQRLAIASTKVIDTTYQIGLWMVSPNFSNVIDFSSEMDLSSGEYIYIPSLEWAP